MLKTAWPQADIGEATSLAEALAYLDAASGAASVVDSVATPVAMSLATPTADSLPHLVVLDLSLPDAQGTEGPARLLARCPGVPILVMSLNAEPAYAARLLGMGVAGYLPKGRAGEDLVGATRVLLVGKRFLTPEMQAQLPGLVDLEPPDPSS